MSSDSDFDPELIRGLEALVETTFPKSCRCCGRTFNNVADYVSQTQSMPNGSQGFKQSLDDDGKVIVDLFRNCPCGSTLINSFNDRRDNTPQGDARRKRFGELLNYLVGRGLELALARRELTKVMNGGQSDILKTIRPPTDKP